LSKNWFRVAKKFLPLIGIIIFIFTIYNLNTEKIIDAFLSINPLFIVLSTLLTIPVLIIRNYSWQIILKEQKISVGYWQSLKIYLIGIFYSSITPGYLGILMKIPYLKEKTGAPYGKLFVNVIINSITSNLSLYGVIIVGAIIVIGTFPELIIISVMWAIILAVILLYFIRKERGEKLLYALIKYLIPKKLKHDFNRFVNTFYIDFPRLRILILPFILGIIKWIIILSQEYIIVLAVGADIPYLYFLLLFPVANVAGYIPISFAGLGVRELTAIVIFSTLFAVQEEKILVFTLVGFIITDIFIAFAGFLLTLTEAGKKPIS